MARNEYVCPVCGKTLTIAGPRNIELHEKSKFHMAAVDKANKEKVINQAPESEPINESVNEPINEIKITTPEVKNDKSKESGKRNNGDSGASGDNGNNSEWDGYLC